MIFRHNDFFFENKRKFTRNSVFFSSCKMIKMPRGHLKLKFLFQIGSIKPNRSPVKNLTIETLSTKGLFIAFKVIFHITYFFPGQFGQLPVNTHEQRQSAVTLNIRLYPFSRGKTANWYRAKKYRIETERLEWLTLTRY